MDILLMVELDKLPPELAKLLMERLREDLDPNIKVARILKNLGVMQDERLLQTPEPGL